MFEFLPVSLVQTDDTIRFQGITRSVSFINHGNRGSFLIGFDIDGGRGFRFTIPADENVLVSIRDDDPRLAEAAAIKAAAAQNTDRRMAQYAAFGLTAEEIREAEREIDA